MVCSRRESGKAPAMGWHPYMWESPVTTSTTYVADPTVFTPYFSAPPYDVNFECMHSFNFTGQDKLNKYLDNEQFHPTALESSTQLSNLRGEASMQLPQGKESRLSRWDHNRAQAIDVADTLAKEVLTPPGQEVNVLSSEAVSHGCSHSNIMAVSLNGLLFPAVFARPMCLDAKPSGQDLVPGRDLNNRNYFEFEFTAKNPRYTRHSLAVVAVANGT
eukprot:1160345-Pelagomonas_calceolata.AAC.6